MNPKRICKQCRVLKKESEFFQTNKRGWQAVGCMECASKNMDKYWKTKTKDLADINRISRIKE